MTFKTILPGAPCPSLSGASLLAFEGPDASAFLQAQTSNDAAALAPGQWQWNAWLTPKGRVQAIFALLRIDTDTFWAVLPDHPAGELQPQLQRFVFRSKVKLRVLDDVAAAAGPVQATEAADRFAGDPGSGIALDFSGRGKRRTLWLLPRDHTDLAAADPREDQAWLAADVAHGLPRLPPAQREAWTPQMLSLERLPAFSVNKGCYPGQEIVARTHFLGQAKRGLVRLAGENLTAGAGVERAGRSAGTVVCATADGREALAVMTLEAEAGLHSSGRECRSIPLLDGLARPF